MSHNSNQTTTEPQHSIDNHPSDSHPRQIAVDVFRLPYYGDETLQGIHAAVPRVDGDWELRVAVAVIVGEGRPKLLACHIIGDDPSAANTVESLLRQVKRQVSIDTMYVGREFGTAEAFSRLKDADIRYVTRIARTPETWEYAEEMQHSVKVVPNYPLSNYHESQAQTSLVLVRFASDDIPEVTPFVTNCEVCDATEPDRRYTREIIEQTQHHVELETMANHLRQQEVLQLIAGIGDWFAESEQGDQS